MNAITKMHSERTGASFVANAACPFQQFEKIAAHTPDAPALEHGGEVYSYRWLNKAANQLAHYLMAQGVARGDRFAVSIDPSSQILVCVLALHKIGAVYIPIDPSFPAARIGSMLADSKPKGYIFACNNAEPLRRDHALPLMIDLNQLAGELAEQPSSNPNRLVSPEDESHIFFTSGTTGKPKGVLATHKNLNHYLQSAANRYQFEAQDRFIAAARFTFSISFFELLLPLYVGACVRIVARDDVLNLDAMVGHFKWATVFHIGPSLLKKVLPHIKQNYPSFAEFAGMRHVSSGGDHVPPDVLELLKEIFVNAEVYVIYGSTEVSCMGCTYLVPRTQTVTQTFVGTPHQNTTIRIEDEQENLLKTGEIGDVLISGPGLVKGYLNLPELTAEKFVERDGRRFYKIGDVGHVTEQGNLALAGRKDFQVQFHGMRIELLEIESNLKNHKAIEDCLVVGLPGEHDDDISLVAYIVFSQAGDASPQELIDHLALYLPDYSIPTKYVQLAALPLNHNGKVDRAALPKPDITNMLVSVAYSAAANEVERELVLMWEKLFNLDGVGVEHNFFELGGDSLAAVQFLSDVEKEFNKFIPLTSLIQHPTIRNIADVITGKTDVPEMQNVTVLKEGDSRLPPLFCLYGVLLYQDLANALSIPNMVCGVFLQEEIELMKYGEHSEQFKAFTDVQVIANKYLHCITQYQAQGPYYLCGESFGGVIALEVAKLLEQRGETVELIAMFDANAPGFNDSLSRLARTKIHLQQTWQQKGANLIGYAKSKLSTRITNVSATSDELNKQPVLDDIREKVRQIASSKHFPQKSQHEIVLFMAQERSPFEPNIPDLGWRDFVGKVNAYSIAGDHLGILQAANAATMASILESYIR